MNVACWMPSAHPLAALYRNLVVCEEAGIGLRCISQLAADGGWQMMRVTLSGRILDASPLALRLLSRFFPEYASGRGRQGLPSALFAWFARSRNWGLERPAIEPRPALYPVASEQPADRAFRSRSGRGSPASSC